MGVYIKDMDMPKEGYMNIRIYPNGYAYCSYFDNKFKKEAVGLPPHGRLVDADAIRADIDENRPGRSYEDAWAMTIMDAAPTIIEAEGKDDDT